jgi:hypothetical protein
MNSEGVSVFGFRFLVFGCGFSVFRFWLWFVVLRQFAAAARQEIALSENWKLATGNWKLETGNWKLKPQYQRTKNSVPPRLRVDLVPWSPSSP